MPWNRLRGVRDGTILGVMGLLSAGCHTLQGAAAGGELALYGLASSGNGAAGDGTALLVLAAGPVIGPTIGAGEDLVEL